MNFFNTLFYLCGFIGCAAISFAPLRVFELIAAVVRGGITEDAHILLLMVVIFVGAVILLYEAYALLGVYACLTSAACTQPGISIWTDLTGFGTVYLGFEAIFFAIRRYARAQPSPPESRAQTRR